jgi:hypothetical protein
MERVKPPKEEVPNVAFLKITQNLKDRIAQILTDFARPVSTAPSRSINYKKWCLLATKSGVVHLGSFVAFGNLCFGLGADPTPQS